MEAASVTAGWGEFLVAAAGAAAALAGLVFVSLSINLSKILDTPGVSGRAAETIILLAGSLVSALMALMPGQTPLRLGIMLLVVGVPTWAVPAVNQIGILRAHTYYRLRYEIQRVVLHQAATLPYLMGALSLFGFVPGRILWLAAAQIMSMAIALINAWVLLVEIIR